MNSRRATLLGLAAFLWLPRSTSFAQTTTKIDLGPTGFLPASFVFGVSTDGSRVYFNSVDASLVPGDTNGERDAFVRDRRTGIVKRLTTTASGAQASGVAYAVSRDERWLAFRSTATNLVPGDTAGEDLFVKDLASGAVTKIRPRTNFMAELSSDGRILLYADDVFCCTTRVYVLDRDADEDGIYDEPGATTETLVVSDSYDPDDGVELASIYLSVDGNFVVFEVGADQVLVPGDVNSAGDVYLWERTTETFERVSVSSTGAVEDTFFYGGGDAVSDDGRYVAFASSATNMVPGDTNGAFDVFVRDRQLGTTTCVSVDPSGIPGNGISTEPTISASGRFVFFQSGASNLAPGDTNAEYDAFLRDRDVDEDGIFDEPGQASTERISVARDGSEADGDSSPRFASDDARFVEFTSWATNLVPGDTNNWPDFFIRDRQAFSLDSLAPTKGSEAGGDLVSVFGWTFLGTAGVTVDFGGAPATVVDSAEGRVRVRTPAGTGVVDVSVTTPLGSATLVGAYSYVDPAIAARFGQVNVGLGSRENVLRVNGSFGDVNREIVLGVGQPLSVEMRCPSTLVSAPFALYVWTGASTSSTLTAQPAGLGNMIFPTPLNGGAIPQPRRIWNNSATVLGTPDFPSHAAPSTVFQRSGGVARPIVVSFQGFIRDAGSRIPQGYSITNAVILRIQ